MGNRLANSLRQALDSLPNPLAQIVYLGSLRDSYTGRYAHEGWATLTSPEEVHTAALQRHYAVFSGVLQVPLEALCEQVREHFAALGEPPVETAMLWLETEPYREVVPVGCSQLEREFFLSQMRAALGVIAAGVSSAAPPGSGAWPRPPLDRRFPHHPDGEKSVQKPGTSGAESE